MTFSPFFRLCSASVPVFPANIYMLFQPSKVQHNSCVEEKTMKRIMTILMLFIAVTFAVPAAFADEGNGNSGNGNSQEDAAEAAEATIAATEGLGATLFENNETDNETDTEDIEETETDVEETTDDETEVDSETQREVKAMDNNHGADMRLLELKREIQRRVLYGNAVVKYLENKSVNQSTVSDLQAISVQLNALIPNIDAAMNNNNTAVQTFLDIKAEAKNLTAQFKIEARKVLKDADIKGLGEIFKNIDKEKFKDINEKIKVQRQELNAEQVATMLQTMGTTATNLAAQVRNGSISAEQARELLKNQLEQLKEGDKQKAAEKIHEQEAKQKVAIADKLAKAKENELERRAKLADKIASELEKKGFEKASKHWEERSLKLEEKQAEQEKKTRERQTQEHNQTNGTGLRVRGFEDNQPDAIPEGPQ
jgi:hypothetical protein